METRITNVQLFKNINFLLIFGIFLENFNSIRKNKMEKDVQRRGEKERD
jgi:hypothetical protein